MANAKPFLRWAGGKRWLAKDLAPILRARLGEEGTYFEPFLGSGAVFFALQPDKAVLSDLNADLIGTFQEVAREPEAILKKLNGMPANRDEYLRIRKSRPRSDLARTIRFLYLNRNCYGGLYRENKFGQFNVPYGGGERNHDYLCRNGSVPAASTILNKPGVKLLVRDFGEVLPLAGAGDVVYCDPTYSDVTRSQFDRYGKTIFRWEDQERLARLATSACTRGAIVVLSNSTCNGTRNLYRDAGVVEVRRRKGLGPRGTERTHVEYLFVLDPERKWSCWDKIGPVKRYG